MTMVEHAQQPKGDGNGSWDPGEVVDYLTSLPGKLVEGVEELPSALSSFGRELFIDGPRREAASADDMRKAVDHWAENDKTPAKDMTHVDDAFHYNYELNHNGADPTDAQYAGRHIAANSIHKYQENQLPQDGVLAPNDEKLDMSTPEARLKTLSRLTQNDPEGKRDGTAEKTCVASSLVGAAIAGGGSDGLLKLMHTMDLDENSAGTDKLEAKGGDLYDLRHKIANHEALTMADMHKLQADLYNQLHDDDVKEHGKAAEGGGITPDAQRKFLESDGAGGLRSMMKSNHMEISNVDASGQGKINHAVLRLGDKAVYDPSVREGGQLVTNSRDVDDYHKATIESVDPTRPD